MFAQVQNKKIISYQGASALMWTLQGSDRVTHTHTHAHTHTHTHGSISLQSLSLGKHTHVLTHTAHTQPHFL